jgi:hypothetical protein
MPSGGRRPGAGRPAGKPNWLTIEVLKEATGLSSWEEIEEERRREAAERGYQIVAPEYAAAARRLRAASTTRRKTGGRKKGTPNKLNAERARIAHGFVRPSR